MRTLLKRAIGATSVCVLAVGMVLGANAFTKNENNKVSEERSELAVKKTTFTKWYSVANPADPKVIGSPIATPPSNNPTGCAQNNPTTHDLCAVQLEVPSEDYEFMSLTDLDNLPSGISATGQDARAPQP